MEKRKHTIQGMRCMMYDIIVFEKLRFPATTRKDKPAGPLYSGDHFHEPAFLVPETPLTCGPKV